MGCFGDHTWVFAGELHMVEDLVTAAGAVAIPNSRQDKGYLTDSCRVHRQSGEKTGGQNLPCTTDSMAGKKNPGV